MKNLFRSIHTDGASFSIFPAANAAGVSLFSNSSTAPSSPEYLPDTGMQLWLVYLLLAVGLVCLITVWGFQRRNANPKALKITLFLVGFTFIAAAVWICNDNYFTERKSIAIMSDALQEIKAARPEEQKTTETDDFFYPVDPEPEETIPEPTEISYIEVDGSRYIGILEIPELSLELPIAYDCSMTTLKKTPGCYSGAPATMDLVIGAHNFTSHFGPVRSLTSGSEVLFIDVNGMEYHYHVMEVTEVTPDQAEAVRNSGHDLTLFTCNSSGARRVVVYCDRTEESGDKER